METYEKAVVVTRATEASIMEQSTSSGHRESLRDSRYIKEVKQIILCDWILKEKFEMLAKFPPRGKWVRGISIHTWRKIELGGEGV